MTTPRLGTASRQPSGHTPGRSLQPNGDRLGQVVVLAVGDRCQDSSCQGIENVFTAALLCTVLFLLYSGPIVPLRN